MLPAGLAGRLSPSRSAKELASEVRSTPRLIMMLAERAGDHRSTL